MNDIVAKLPRIEPSTACTLCGREERVMMELFEVFDEIEDRALRESMWRMIVEGRTVP